MFLARAVDELHSVLGPVTPAHGTDPDTESQDKNRPLRADAHAINLLGHSGQRVSFGSGLPIRPKPAIQAAKGVQRKAECGRR
jgi:hypothetical protein